MADLSPGARRPIRPFRHPRWSVGSARSVWQVLLHAVALLAWAGAAPAGMIRVGDPALPFSLSDIEGNRTILAEILQEGEVLLFFTSVGCRPCEESLPAIREAAVRYEDRLQVVSIVLSDICAIRRRSPPAGSPPGETILVDEFENNCFTTADKYGVMGTPTSILVGRDGTIRWVHVGLVTSEHVRVELWNAVHGTEGSQPVAQERRGKGSAGAEGGAENRR